MSTKEIIQDIQLLKELKEQQCKILNKYLNETYNVNIVLKENLAVLTKQMINMLDNVELTLHTKQITNRLK